MDKKDFEEVIVSFQDELKNVRTGRASASLVEDLQVDYFGSKSPLKQIASVSVADAHSIVISPWGKDSLADIEKVINESDLGVNPINDGNSIRVNFPALTEERRRELVKVIGKKTEEARIKVRRVREDIWNGIQKNEKSGEISEDEKFKKKDELQKMVDDYNKKIEEMFKKKEEEIMTI